ncbi:hypothetical protein BH11PSE2_BH11PSE2_22610 [soil metagenome]
MRRMSLMIAAAAAMATQAGAQARNPAQEYVEIGRILSFNEICTAVSPLRLAALEAARSEIYLNVPPEQLSAAQMQISQQSVAVMSVKCRSPEAEAFAGQIRALADIQRDSWIIRADALARAEAAHPWSAGMTGLGVAAPALKTAAAAAMKRSPNAAAIKADAETLAATLLENACPRRKTVRSATPRACPNPAAAYGEQAEAMVKVIETFGFKFNAANPAELK